MIRDSPPTHPIITWKIVKILIIANNRYHTYITLMMPED